MQNEKFYEYFQYDLHFPFLTRKVLYYLLFVKLLKVNLVVMQDHFNELFCKMNIPSQFYLLILRRQRARVPPSCGKNHRQEGHILRARRQRRRKTRKGEALRMSVLVETVPSRCSRITRSRRFFISPDSSLLTNRSRNPSSTTTTTSRAL